MFSSLCADGKSTAASGFVNHLKGVEWSHSLYSWIRSTCCSRSVVSCWERLEMSWSAIYDVIP